MGKRYLCHLTFIFFKFTVYFFILFLEMMYDVSR